MLVCLVVAALAVAGIYSNRRRLLLAATAVACFLVAEAVPLFLTSSPNWGPGRWVRIAGAVIALVGLALVTFRPAEHTRSWTARV
jgi:protein-S-isoprenylcysteine O-methyltransferase Ste14